MTLIEEAIEALKTQYSNPFTDDDELIQRLYALDDEIAGDDMIITTIKIKRRKYEITDKDMFLDNGLATGLLTQAGRLMGWDYETPTLSEENIQHVLSFPQVEYKTKSRFWKGCRLFSITAKEST